MDRLEIPDHYLRDTSMMSTCHANTVVVCELFWSFSLEKSRNPQKIYVLLLNLAADCLAPLVSRDIHWTFQTLQDAGMESYADDLWQNLLASGQAAEAKDPAELTWWAAGAIDVEAGHNLGNTLATKKFVTSEAENMQEMAWEYQWKLKMNDLNRLVITIKNIYPGRHMNKHMSNRQN